MALRFTLTDLKIVLADLGQVFYFSAPSFLAPIPFAFFYGEPLHFAFSYFIIAVLVFLTGLALKKFFPQEKETETKHAFLTASLLWLLFTAFAAMPFVFVQGTSFVDGFFESMSAITTTGLSVLDNELDSVPKSLVFWRSFLGWFGGMGIIVLALIGIVSAYSTTSKLFFAEGRDDRIKPNLKHTVKELWKIYLAITVLGIVALLAAGMGFFDALNYAMSAVSTSGVNTSPDKLAIESNLLVEIILTLLLVIGSTNFALHYVFIKKKSLKVYLQSSEFKSMLAFSLLGGLLVLPKIALFAQSFSEAVRISFFHSFSAQLGGFMAITVSYIAASDDFVKLVFASLMVIGGSSGSTSGGLKVSRVLLVLKQFFWKIKETTLTRGVVFPRKFEGTEIEPQRLSDVNHFVIVYLAVLFVGTMFLTTSGNSLADSFLEASSAQANAGISSGITYKGMPLPSEISLILLMWLGRLDIIPLFVGLGIVFSGRGAKPKIFNQKTS